MAAPKKTASPKPQHRDIPFAQLHFTGTYHVRKMSSAPIEPLAATIARRGLLPNLIVVEDLKGRFDIAAGRRRFLAVGHNVARDRREPRGGGCMAAAGMGDPEVALRCGGAFWSG